MSIEKAVAIVEAVATLRKKKTFSYGEVWANDQYAEVDVTTNLSDPRELNKWFQKANAHISQIWVRDDVMRIRFVELSQS